MLYVMLVVGVFYLESPLPVQIHDSEGPYESMALCRERLRYLQEWMHTTRYPFRPMTALCHPEGKRI